MGVWACGARTEDTSMAKTLAVEILGLDPVTDVVVPPIPPKQKHGRGFNHPMTARLLCPRKDLTLFDSNPQWVLYTYLFNTYNMQGLHEQSKWSWNWNSGHGFPHFHVRWKYSIRPGKRAVGALPGLLRTQSKTFAIIMHRANSYTGFPRHIYGSFICNQ